MTSLPRDRLRVVFDASVFVLPGARHRGLYPYCLAVLRVLLEHAPELEVVLFDPLRALEVEAAPEPELRLVTDPGLNVDSRLGWAAFQSNMSRAYTWRRPREREVYLFPWAGLTPWRMPPRSVAIVYDLIQSCWPPWAEARKLGGLRDAFEGWRIGSAERLIAISESTRRDALAVWGLPPEKVVAIPHLLPPTEPPPEEPSPRVAELLDRAGSYLLFLGAREPRKGLGPLLERWEEEHPEGVSLVLAGPARSYDPGDDARIERLKARGDLHLLTHVDEGEKASLLAGAAALVFPTRYEGYGLPVTEAMLLGTPVVTFDNSSLPEACGDAGGLVADGDYRALMEEALRLARDPAVRSAASERALERTKRFDQAAVGRRYAEVLGELVNET